MNTATVYKKNGELQRKDVKLNKYIAGALREKILKGETLYPNKGKGKHSLSYITEEGEEIREVLSVHTMRDWVKRNNVIPDTGVTLRDYLNKAREEKRTLDRERRAEALVNEAEKVFHRTLKLRTNLPVRNMFGQTIVEEGRIVRKENHNLLRIKNDTAKYVAERLNPERYGKIEKSENKHFVFSLADLRRQKNAREVKEVEESDE